MTFKNDFQKREFIARRGLDELKIKYPNIFKYKIFYTEDEYAPFDAYFFAIDKNGEIKKQIWIELKIRDRTFDDYLLESKKLSSLRKLRDKNEMNIDDVTFLYINFLPNETVIWNITNVDLNKSEKLIANKATSLSRYDKIEKDVVFLDPKNGRRLKYVLDDDKIIYKEKKRIKNN